MSKIITGVQTGIDVTASTTKNFIGDLSRGVLSSLTGVAKGVEGVISGVGDAVKSLGEGVQVVSHSFAEGIGNVTESVVGGLGTVIEKIPIVGKPTAYVVKGAGKGVYYVVLTVSDVVGTVGTTFGKTAKTTSKVLVFTIASGRDVATGVVDDANKVVKDVLGRVKKLSKLPYNKKSLKRGKKATKKTKKAKKGKKGKKTKRS